MNAEEKRKRHKLFQKSIRKYITKYCVNLFNKNYKLIKYTNNKYPNFNEMSINNSSVDTYVYVNYYDIIYTIYLSDIYLDYIYITIGIFSAGDQSKREFEGILNFNDIGTVFCMIKYLYYHHKKFNFNKKIFENLSLIYTNRIK